MVVVVDMVVDDDGDVNVADHVAVADHVNAHVNVDVRGRLILRCAVVARWSDQLSVDFCSRRERATWRHSSSFGSAGVSSR